MHTHEWVWVRNESARYRVLNCKGKPIQGILVGIYRCICGAEREGKAKR